MPDHVFADEAMLMAWGESDTQGPWIKLRLPSSEHLEPFRGMTKAKGDKAGQRLGVVMVEIGDDEQVKPVEKGGVDRHQLSGILRRAEAFQRFMKGRYPGPWARAIRCADGDPAAAAGLVICVVCEIEDRVELKDPDSPAAKLFDRLIRAPYMASQEGRG